MLGQAGIAVWESLELIKEQREVSIPNGISFFLENVDKKPFPEPIKLNQLHPDYRAAEWAYQKAVKDLKAECEKQNREEDFKRRFVKSS